MARSNSLLDNAALQLAVEHYTGRKVARLERYDDPRVAGCVALRARLEGDDYDIDFLLSANAPARRTAEQLADELEECEFASWPPRAGALKFF